jgi:hypothetical protein
MSLETYMLNELIKETPASSTNPMVHVNMCGRNIYLVLFTSCDKRCYENLLVYVIKIPCIKVITFNEFLFSKLA